jgi:hypothetical protein
MGDPEFQEIVFCDVTAPLHVHYERNVPAIAALQIQQTAIERARDGVEQDVFYQGVRQFEKVLKPEYADMNEETLCFEVGEDWEKLCYEMKPTKQRLKPSDALVTTMLQSWNRKRYGSHQEIAVTYGGVLRLERPEEPKQIEHKPAAVFEEEDTEEEKGRLALARPAKDAAEMDRWSEAGEFKTSPVTFVKADGGRTELRADLERHLEQAKIAGPQNPRPEKPVMVGKPEDEPPVAQHAPPPPKPQQPRIYASKEEEAIGTGREGIGGGADPEKWGKHSGFRMTRLTR